jgi:hypothetical protein
MHGLTCPVCGKYCLSAARKLFLGPARSVPCASCGARVSVPWLPSILLSLLASVAPIVSGAFALTIVGNFSSVYALVGAFIVGAVIGALPFLWASYRFVPLVVRGA